jgi:hypothetical protein
MRICIQISGIGGGRIHLALNAGEVERVLLDFLLGIQLKRLFRLFGQSNPTMPTGDPSDYAQRDYNQ